MKVIVDTSAWSLVLRRSSPDKNLIRDIDSLVRHGRVQMLGVIRQELLSGIQSAERFEALRLELANFPDLSLEREDHEHAARLFNRCRSRGVQANVVDMLICAVSQRHDMRICTFDRDFNGYAKHVSLRFHAVGK